MPKIPPTEPRTDDDTVWDFDQDLRDLQDNRSRDAVRALVFGLPARPGTRR